MRSGGHAEPSKVIFSFRSGNKDDRMTDTAENERGGHRKQMGPQHQLTRSK